MAERELIYRLKVDTKTGKVELSKFQQELDKTGGKGTTAGKNIKTAFDSTASSLQSVKNIVGALGIAFGTIQIAQKIREGVTAAWEFNEAWTKVGVILRNEPPDVLKSFKEQILSLPPAFGTAKENAEAFYQIISSGFGKPAEALELLTQSAIAAAGGFTTTENAAKSGAAVLNAYGLTAKDAKGVFDQMSKTVDLGVISFEELSSQLGQIVPIAATNNVSFKELSGAIAALTLQGLPAGQAITGLRSTITSIVSPSKDATAAAKELGIRWDEGMLKAVGLEGVLKQLTAKGVKPTSEQMIALTGRVEAANVVMALTSKGGAKALTDSIETLGHASDGAGASAEALEAAQKELSFQWKETQNSIINAAAALGDKWAPTLAAALARIREFGSAVIENVGTAIDFFGKLISSAASVVSSIASVGKSIFTAFSPGNAGLIGTIAESFSEAYLNLTTLTAGVIAFGFAFTALKIGSWVTLLGGISGAFTALSGAIATSTAAGGTLALSLAAIPYAVIAAAIAGIAYAWVQYANAAAEAEVATAGANAMVLKLAADSQSKGVPGVAELVQQFNQGKISANELQISLAKVINEFAKLNPGQYFKESNLKNISALVESIGGASTGSLLGAAKEASSAVEQIKLKMAGFEAGSIEAKIAQSELSKATAIQGQKWNELKKALDPANKSTKESGEETKKAAKEIEGWGSALGLVIPKLKQTVADGQKYIDYLKKNKAEAILVKEAELKLIEAKQNLKKALDALNGPQIKNIGLMEDAVDLTGDWKRSLEVVNPLLDRMGKEHLKTINDKLKETNDRLFTVTGAFKTLGVTSTSELRKLADDADSAFMTIRDSGEASAQDVLRAQKAAIEAIVKAYKAAGSEVPKEIEQMVADIDKQLGEIPKAAKDSASEMRQEISTVFNDLSKGIADSIVEWEGFWGTLKNIGKEFAKSMLRIFIDDLLAPLTKDGGILDQISKKISSALGGLFGGGAGGTGGAFKWGDLLKGLGAAGIIGGATAGIAALVGRFTRRGKEKETATGAAETLSTDVWKIVADVKAGNTGIEEGATTIRNLWAAYEKFLNDNLKDQTVIARSIEGQRNTLDQGLAALQSIDKGQGAISEAVEPFAAISAGLATIKEELMALQPAPEGLWDSFLKGGPIIGELRKQLMDLGVDIATFEDYSHAKQMKADWDDLVSQFRETKVVTKEMGDIMRAAGVDVRYFAIQAMELERIGKIRTEITSLRNAIEELIPVQKTDIQLFIDTGVVTDALREKIEEFGGSVAELEEFAAIKKMRDDFAGLAAAIIETGEGAEQLKAIFESVGADTSILASSGKIKELKQDQKDILELQKQLAAIAPPAPVNQTDLQKYITSGELTESLRTTLKESGADVAKFEAFTAAKNANKTAEDMLKQFGQNKTITQQMLDFAKNFGQTLQGTNEQVAAQLESIKSTTGAIYQQAALALGIEVGKLAESVETEIGKLQEAITTALGEVRDKLEAAFIASGEAVVRMLDQVGFRIDDKIVKLDIDLTGMIEKVNAFLVDEINKASGHLLTAIANLELAIAGNVSGIAPPPPDAYTPPPEEERPDPLIGPATRGTYGRSYAEGTPFVPFTGLAMVHQGERITPAAQNRGGGAVTINETVNFYNVNDPNEQHRNMQRLNREMLNGLRR